MLGFKLRLSYKPFFTIKILFSYFLSTLPLLYIIPLFLHSFFGGSLPSVYPFSFTPFGVFFNLFIAFLFVLPFSFFCINSRLTNSRRFDFSNRPLNSLFWISLAISFFNILFGLVFRSLYSYRYSSDEISSAGLLPLLL